MAATTGPAVLHARVLLPHDRKKDPIADMLASLPASEVAPVEEREPGGPTPIPPPADAAPVTTIAPHPEVAPAPVASEGSATEAAAMVEAPSPAATPREVVTSVTAAPLAGLDLIPGARRTVEATLQQQPNPPAPSIAPLPAPDPSPPLASTSAPSFAPRAADLPPALDVIATLMLTAPPRR